MTQSYQEIRDSFVWERPGKFNFARDVIDQWAAKDAAKTAMLWIDDHGNEERISFSDISVASCRAAGFLESAGVKRGDTVIILLGRQVAWWVLTTACIRLGAVVSPGTTQLSSKDIAYRVNATDATCVVTEASCIEKVNEVEGDCPSLTARIIVDGEADGWLNYAAGLRDASEEFVAADTDANEDSLCYFTSGTTGYPKMCIQNHAYGTGHVTTGKFWLDLKEDDLHWNISDTGWAKAAWSSYFGPWLCGAALFVHHSAAFDPDASLAMFKRYPITTFCGAPTIYRLFVQKDLSVLEGTQLRHCVGAGEPLNPEVIERWREATGLVIRDGYGQTESVILCGNMPMIEPRFGSMGKPMPGIDLAVIDDEGNSLPPNEEGDIAVRVVPERPIGLFKEYKNEPEKTAACFRGDWYITGDRATVDEDGYFWFVSRADDVILSAGYRIGPFEVESALLEHSAVVESAVVGSPHEERGEVVKAFIVLASGEEASDELVSELQNHVKKVTAPYKYPRRIEFVDELPKTVSGKIRRVELRERELNP
ncbi:MAG: AMP-binding protein [Gammaproteobacteria bacterium]|nr:AMP-binding protein [Gammaproteobacteria bacterium]